MDGGAWWAAVHGVARSQTRLNDFSFTFHFHALEKEMATHSSVLAWKIPGMEEPNRLPSMGSHRVRHDWSDLAAAAAAAAGSVHQELLHLKSLPAFVFVQHKTFGILFRVLPMLIHLEQENLKQDYALNACPFINIAQHLCSSSNLPFLFIARYGDRKQIIQVMCYF